MASGTATLDLSQPLALRRSLRRGWRSFNRTAGRFVVFMLIVEAVSEASHLLVQFGSTPLEQGGPPAVAALLILGLGLSLTLFTHWWMTLGLFRGAWMALSGGQPRLADLLRWDGDGLRRWSAMWLLIFGLLGLVAAGTALSHALVSLFAPALPVVPLLLGGVLALVLLLSQLFCLPLVVLERRSASEALRLGLGGLRHHPGAWMLLWLVQIVPQVLMLVSQVLAEGLVLGVRLVTLPLAMCILTACYLDRLDALDGEPGRVIELRSDPSGESLPSQQTDGRP